MPCQCLTGIICRGRRDERHDGEPLPALVTGIEDRDEPLGLAEIREEVLLAR
jgi:hypothetical protein